MTYCVEYRCPHSTTNFYSACERDARECESSLKHRHALCGTHRRAFAVVNLTQTQRPSVRGGPHSGEASLLPLTLGQTFALYLYHTGRKSVPLGQKVCHHPSILTLKRQGLRLALSFTDGHGATESLRKLLGHRQGWDFSGGRCPRETQRQVEAQRIAPRARTRLTFRSASSSRMPKFSR